MNEIDLLKAMIESGLANTKQKARYRYLVNRDDIIRKRREYVALNRDSINQRRRELLAIKVKSDSDFVKKERKRLAKYNSSKKSLDWVSRNKEKRHAIQKKYREKNQEKIKAYRSTKEYKDSLSVWSARHYSSEKYKETKKIWKSNNPDKVYWSNKMRSVLIRQATIGGKLFMNEIISLYRLRDSLSQENGVRMVVDHICPIRHSLICGLNVPWNMRIISHDENAKKSNKLDINLILS